MPRYRAVSAYWASMAVSSSFGVSWDLVMVPEGTPEDQWEDPMMQFIFHTGDQTQFYCDEAALEEGTLLNVYHRGTATMSIPPQGSALELRLLEGEG